MSLKTKKEKLQDLVDEQKELEKEIADEESETIKKRQMEYRPLAIKAHDLFCTYNHTDGCSWEYEIIGGEHMWSSDSHVRWLNKLEEAVTKHKLTIGGIDEVLTEYKKITGIAKVLWVLR